MSNFFLQAHPTGYTLSTDPARLDVAAIHRWLSEESYWARHIPRATVERAIANSLNFGLYASDGQLAGFCRVVTDRATFAWLCDVFVLPEHRGHGLAKKLFELAKLEDSTNVGPHYPSIGSREKSVVFF